MTSYPELYEYCQNDEQRRVIATVVERGSVHAAARALKKNTRSVERMVKRIKTYAARKGYQPERDATHPVPDGQALKGQSTLYRRGEDEPVLQWVKTHAAQERQLEILQDAVSACMEGLPAERTVPAPTHGTTKDLLNLHILTDYHMGCLAWGEETGGDDWDMNIAERLLVDWFRNAVDRSPNAHTGVLCQLGDLMHQDNLEAMTPQSGHRLDVDSRMAYVVRVVVRCLRQIMRMMLEKYPHVHVIMSDANHDPTGAIWMREWMAELYRDEPRVTVDQSPDTFNVYEHGAVSLGFHHGHKVKADGIAKAFAERFREVYGRTSYTYLHTGHLHHYAGKDHGIGIVTQHPTMAAKDNYAASHGYASARFATVETYSATYGRVGSVEVTPEMVRG